MSEPAVPDQIQSVKEHDEQQMLLGPHAWHDLNELMQRVIMVLIAKS